MADENSKKENSGKENETLLIPSDNYMKAGMQLGTKIITSYMKKYIYRRRLDGLAIINKDEIDKKLQLASNFLSQYKPEEIIVVCKRESGWKAVRLFSELTGIKAFTKKYPAGIITNIILPDFFEPSLLLITDPWLDKAPLADALKLNIPVISLCDSNNITSNIDLVVPCNNKSNKSLGMIFYILAREYCKKRGIGAKIPKVDEFIGEPLEQTFSSS